MWPNVAKMRQESVFFFYNAYANVEAKWYHNYLDLHDFYRNLKFMLFLSFFGRRKARNSPIPVKSCIAKVYNIWISTVFLHGSLFESLNIVSFAFACLASMFEGSPMFCVRKEFGALLIPDILGDLTHIKRAYLQNEFNENLIRLHMFEA